MHASLGMKDYLVGMYLDTNFYNSLFKSVRPENPRADDRMTAIRPFFVNEIFPKENGFRIWDAPKETIDNILKRDSVYSMVFPTEGMVSMVNYRNGTVGYWDSLSRFWPVVSNPYPNAIPMAPVYYMLFKYKILAAMDGKVYEWNLHSTERHFYTDDGLRNKIVSIAINKNRTRIFTASSDGKGKIWTANQNGHDLPKSKPLPFNLGRDIMSSSAFSHSDSMIVTGFSNGRVKLWAASDGALLQEMNGHSPQSVNSVAFSPDDAFVYTGSLDGTYRRWQVKHKGVHGTIQETTPEQRSRLFDDLFKYGIIDKMATAADTPTGTKK
jgi:hypothetical protein